MYIRKKTRIKDGKRHDYWALVEFYRTERGPRQRTVAWLGELDKAGRVGIEKLAKRSPESQQGLFEKSPEPEWVDVNVNGIRVENIKDFGGPWFCLEIIRRLNLDQFFKCHIPQWREQIPWSTMALLLVICRLCDPSSELHIAEHLFEKTALSDLLGIPLRVVNEDRLYRALDKLLPHKDALERHLKESAGNLFNLDYDLFLYDVTSTSFEKEERVLSHILVCFLAYVLWKTLEGLCRQAGFGDEPRKAFHELSHIKLTDVVLPTRNGKEIRLRCVGTPTKHQLILLQRLKLVMPKRFLK